MASSAVAQTAPPATQNTASGDDTKAIIVTARKRSEGIADVPLAVSALTQESLSQRNVLDARQLNDFVPGFRVSPQPGATSARSFSSFTIRGLNPNTLHPDRQNVGVFIDGISIGGSGFVPGLANVQRVEVVKGPQSAYFGRATFGGAVNYVTTPPSLTEQHGGASFQFNSRGSLDMRGYVSAPIVNDVLAVRLDAQRNVVKSGYKNFGYGGDLGDEKTESLSATVEFKPVEASRFKAYYTRWWNDDGGNATYTLTQNYQNCNLRGGTTPNYFCGGFTDLPTSTISQNQNVDPSVLTRLASAEQILNGKFAPIFGLQRDAHFGYVSNDTDLPMGLTLSSYFAWHRSRYQLVQDSGQRFETAGRTSTNLTAWDVKNKIAETRIQSDANSRLKFLLGFNYFNQETAADSFGVRNGTLISSLAPQGQKTNTYGIFGSLGYDLTDRLNVSVEARRQVDKIETQVFASGFTLSGKTKSFTPRAIVQYKITPRLNVYTSYHYFVRSVKCVTDRLPPQ